MALSWRFQLLKASEAVSDTVVGAILQVFRDGFGLHDGWSLNGVRHALIRSDAMGLLYRAGDIVGYAFYTAPVSQLEGQHLLWEDAICVRKCVQRMGYASRALSEVAAFFPHRRFGWVGGRTQNPIVFLRYARLGPVFPFDELYTSLRGRRIMRFLLAHIAEVQESARADQLEQATGFCRGIYEEGKLGDYDVDLQAGALWESMLRGWGFDREKGDALLVVARLTHNLIQGGK